MKTQWMAAFVACCVSTPGLSQVATALVCEGDAPSSMPDQTIGLVLKVAVNASGGYAVHAHSTGPGGDLSHFIGSLDGGPPQVLMTETNAGMLTQSSFLFDSFGLSDSGDLVYGARIDSSAPNHSIWRNSTPLYVALESVPVLPVHLWETFSGMQSVAGGAVAFWATTIGHPLGSTVGEHLFIGDDLVLSSEIPQTQGDLDIGHVRSNFRFSRSGEQFIVEVNLFGIPGRALMLSGLGLRLDGVLALQDNPVPAAAGGVLNERWSQFRGLDVIDDGTYMFTAETDTDPLINSVMVVDGVIRRREADLVDGQILRGSARSARMNAAGRVAYVWGIGAANDPLQALFVDDQLILQEGDAVDHDGDGQVDSGFIFRGIRTGTGPVFAHDGAIYLTAEIETPSGDRECLLRIDRSVGTSYCQSATNSTGFPATIRATGSASVLANDLALRAEGLPPLVPGLFYFGHDQLQMPFGDGVRCVGGTIFRLPVGSANAAGVLVHALDLSAPPSAGNVTGGTRWNYQGWFRDNAAMGSGFNLTDGLFIDFEP